MEGRGFFLFRFFLRGCLCVCLYMCNEDWHSTYEEMFCSLGLIPDLDRCSLQDTDVYSAHRGVKCPLQPAFSPVLDNQRASLCVAQWLTDSRVRGARSWLAWPESRGRLAVCPHRHIFSPFRWNNKVSVVGSMCWSKFLPHQAQALYGLGGQILPVKPLIWPVKHLCNTEVLLR